MVTPPKESVIKCINQTYNGIEIKKKKKNIKNYNMYKSDL